MLFFLLFSPIFSLTYAQEKSNFIYNKDSKIFSYVSTLSVNASQGSIILKIEADNNINQFIINAYKASSEKIQFTLKYNKGNWQLKKNEKKATFFPISDKTFLKILKMEDVLPNSKLFIQLLKGMFPYQKHIINIHPDSKITIEYSKLIQEIQVVNNKPSIISLINKDNGKTVVNMNYSKDGIEATHFFIPYSINIDKGDNKSYLRISLKSFKENDQ